MRKVLLLIVILCSTTCFGQTGSFRFKILTTTMKIKKDQNWLQWKKIGTYTGDIVTLDVSKKVIDFFDPSSKQTTEFKIGNILDTQTDETAPREDYILMCFDVEKTIFIIELRIGDNTDLKSNFILRTENKIINLEAIPAS